MNLILVTLLSIVFANQPDAMDTGSQQLWYQWYDAAKKQRCTKYDNYTYYYSVRMGSYTYYAPYTVYFYTYCGYANSLLAEDQVMQGTSSVVIAVAALSLLSVAVMCMGGKGARKHAYHQSNQVDISLLK